MWLLEKSVYDAIAAARDSGIKFTAEQQSEFAEQFTAADTSRIMVVAGSNAEIHIKGVLTNSPDIFARFFGGGNITYPEIISALAEADVNPDIKQIIMRFDSPGGEISGMFDAMAAMQTTKKTIKAVIGTMAASAAFGLASQADFIEAHNRASMVGSIGIAFQSFLNDKIVTLTSTKAPKKRPDLKTEAGRAVIVEQLDEVHALFAEGIADGRGVTVETVNEEFGQGATLLADEALKRGMIDGIAKVGLQSVKNTKSTTAKSGDKQEANNMDLKTLQADHPELYASVVKDCVASERDRVSAHLTMGQASGDMKTALAAINDGTAMTAALLAKYQAAGMNRKAISDQQDDSDGADAGDNANQTDEEKEAAASQSLLEAVAENCGVELGSK